jgi:tyrosyl-tRNA synthetase
MMSRLAQIGIEPIFLIGGATGMIGDPSGKSKERSLLNEKEIGSNLEGIEKDITTTYQKILHTLKSDPTKYQL